MRVTGVFIGVMLFVISFTQCGGENKTEGTSINASELFSRNCALCHGSDGKLGLTGASDLSMSKLTLEKSIEVITHGRGKMTPFSGLLTDEEIKAVAQHVETLRKP